MKIAVDGGGLCASAPNQFGNYIVSKNLIQALQLYDKKNQYTVYSFCNKPKFIKPTNTIHYQNLQPKFFWSSVRLSVEEGIKKHDFFLALNQAIPLITRTKIISFSHGLSFHYHPELYPDSYRQLKQQLSQMIKRSDKIVVSSKKVKEEITSIYRLIDLKKILVIPYGIPFDMVEKKLKIPPSSRLKNFFLAVGMNHPIKNFSQLPTDKFRFIIANNVSRSKLKKLYCQAKALVTTSFYESFNLPVLEALSLGCPVIGLKSAIIPELVPYVNVCQNEKELISMLDKAKNNKLKLFDKKEIQKAFSWKNYVKKLIELYNDTHYN